MPPRLSLRRTTGIATIAGLLGLACATFAELKDSTEPGIRIESGFKIQLIAGPELANDIWSMTLDKRGQPVVSGRGYVRRLIDENKDGRADRAVEVTKTTSGAMGLCYDGDDLLLVGDGGLWRHRDSNGDGISDGVPEKILALGMGEHGAHAIRKGPDGGWYLIAGNDAGLATNLTVHSSSWIKSPIAGALIRLDRNLQNPTIFAHGFRNPYDFDFAATGKILTWDSDCERDYLLPWYVPTRIFEIQASRHHGWQLGGYLRTWARPAYDEDSVQPLHWMGRASPTGVVAYRHNLFPAAFRNGAFFLDWTFGKIWFLPASGTKPGLFMEPAGQDGFAPTDAVVEPDGSLLVSIGGRRTRGAVYRVRPEQSQPRLPEAPASALEVLHFPQPLDAWSRARWEPVALKLGRAEFEKQLTGGKLSEPDVIRCAEVMKDLFGGLNPATVRESSLGMSHGPDGTSAMLVSIEDDSGQSIDDLLIESSRNPNPTVRSAAWRKLVSRAKSGSSSTLKAAVPLLANGLADQDIGVRHWARLASAQLTEAEWNQVSAAQPNQDAALKLGMAWAAFERSPTTNQALAAAALEALRSGGPENLQLRALRLTVKALGGWSLDKPSRELFTAFELAAVKPEESAYTTNLTEICRKLLRVSHSESPVSREAARLLAMMEDESAESIRLVLDKITPSSSADLDFHYLTVLARLRGSWATNDPARVAEALLGMDRKLANRQLRPKQVWSQRLQDLGAELSLAHYAIVPAMLAHPGFATPSHVDIPRGAMRLGNDARAAAKLFLAAVRKDPSFPWTSPLIDLLSLLPPDETFPELRKKWNDPVVRLDVLAVISARPQELDRPKMWEAIGSSHVPSVKAGSLALTRLRGTNTVENLAPILRALKRSFEDPTLKPVRPLLANAFQRQSGVRFGINEASAGPVNPEQYYQPLFDWFKKQHPDSLSSLNPVSAQTPAAWRALLPAIESAQADPLRGRKWFAERACTTCHEGAAALGPSLVGVSKRMPVSQLLESIFEPSLTIAPAYEMQKYQLRDGQEIEGMEVFISADGVIVQTAPGKTIRLAREEIVTQDRSGRSLMPENLLEGMKPGDIADLLAFVRGL